MVDVWEIALGFMDAQILLTAEEIGVFECLAGGPRTAGEVAAATGLPADSARRLLTALCALKLVERRSDGRYENRPEADEQLVRGRPGYIGGMFHHLKHALYPVWGHLREALVEGRAQWSRAFAGPVAPNEALYEDPHALRAFMDGMHVLGYRAAAAFAAKAPELERVESLVDVGGASGAFVIALAERFPRLRGAVLDLPPVRSIAEDHFRRHGLSERLRFHAADFWNDPIPAGADAYGLGFVLHDWDDGGGSFLLDKLSKAARPGALLIVGEYLLDEDRTGPRFVARQDLNMLVAARGRERTAGEYRAWLARFGFEVERVCHAWHGKHFLVARRVAEGSRPAG